jgi:DNA-binding MarR family transcriptional regulator
VKKEGSQGEVLSKKNPIRELPGVYNSYVLLMGLAQRIWVERLERHYQPKHISVRQVWIMMASRYSDKSQKEIADGVGINQNVMVRLVDDLERKGLIQRKQNLKNRRERILVLTAKGRAFLAWADTNFERVADEIFFPANRTSLNNFRHYCRAVVARYYDDESGMWEEMKGIKPTELPKIPKQFRAGY